MKLITLQGSLAALILLITGCEEATRPASSEGTSQGSSQETASATSSPNDREPIKNTSPEGSSMDPTSNAIIVFDGSGSMAGEPIEQAKRAVITFIKGAPEDLNIGLVVFDNTRLTGSEIVPLGRGPQQRQKLAREIVGIRAGGGTPLGSAIKTGTNSLIEQFQKQLRYGDIRLIVVTDGIAGDAQEFYESIKFAGDYHVPIYTIGFRIRSEHPLHKFSEAYFSAQDEKELLAAMEETLAELDDSISLDL